MSYPGDEAACQFCGATLLYTRRGQVKQYCDGVCKYRHEHNWRELTCTTCGAAFMGNKGKRCPACRRMMAV